MNELRYIDFAPVMNYPAPEDLKVFDFTQGYRPDYIRNFEWGIGRYNEKRRAMYTSALYDDKRDIHMGIDIWAKAGRPVFSFYEGEVCYVADNNTSGNYGPTLVIRYSIKDTELFALYGHLSRLTLENISPGESVQKGQQIATLGSEEVNGEWVPHLHFQLSWQDPGQADMPGVVTEANRREALETYPDPRLVLGPIYDDDI